jgi:hypothetical protein
MQHVLMPPHKPFSYAVTVDMAKSMDVPLLKKYGVYNSGLVPQERYTPGLLPVAMAATRSPGLPWLSVSSLMCEVRSCTAVRLRIRVEGMTVHQRGIFSVQIPKVYACEG